MALKADFPSYTTRSKKHSSFISLIESSTYLLAHCKRTFSEHIFDALLLPLTARLMKMQTIIKQSRELTLSVLKLEHDVLKAFFHFHYLCFSFLLWCKCRGILCSKLQSLFHIHVSGYIIISNKLFCSLLSVGTFTMKFHRVYTIWIYKFTGIQLFFLLFFLLWVYTCLSNHERQRWHKSIAWRRDILSVLLISFVGC